MVKLETRFEFSKTKLLKLDTPPKGKRLVVYDSKIPKLALRKTDSGSMSFNVIRRTGGAVAWVKVGGFPETTVEQARKLADQILGEFSKGANPVEAKRAYKGQPTLDEFFREFAAKHGNKKLSWKADEQRYRDYLKRPLGTKKLHEITKSMVSSVLSSAESKGKAVATVRNIRALASVIFAKAVEWGKLDVNPVSGLRVAGKKVNRDRFLLANELPRFFESVMNEPNETARDFVMLALLTGVRRSNLCAIKWKDLNLEEGIWKIGRTKNGEPQNVTLSPEANEILERRLETAKATQSKGSPLSPYVFPGTGESGHYADPKKAVIRIMERAEIPYGRKVENGVTLHDLRRTLGSWQAKTGASLLVIGKSLNHKSPQTTAIYARLDLDPVRQSVNTATAAMLEAGGAKEAAQVIPLKKVGDKR